MFFSEFITDVMTITDIYSRGERKKMVCFQMQVKLLSGIGFRSFIRFSSESEQSIKPDSNLQPWM